MRALAHILLFSVVWLLWSGHTTPLLLSFGAVSVLLVSWLSHRMDVVDREAHLGTTGFRIWLYLPWLLLEIVKSNLHVARVVLSPSLPIAPRLVRVPCSQVTDVGHAIFANSITITPGTVSLDVRQRTILVHALTTATAEGVQDGQMNRRVTALEGATS